MKIFHPARNEISCKHPVRFFKYSANFSREEKRLSDFASTRYLVFLFLYKDVRIMQIRFFFLTPWIYNIRRNVNSDFSIVTMRKVAILFFELGVVKKFMQKF